MAKFAAPLDTDEVADWDASSSGELSPTQPAGRHSLRDVLDYLVNLTYDQSQMIRDLQGANKELAEHIITTNGKLSLVESQLGYIRLTRAAAGTEGMVYDRGLADLDFRKTTRAGDAMVFPCEYDSAAVRFDTTIDLADIATTLSAGPQRQNPLRRKRSTSRSSNGGSQERRTSRPHRNEHVKRARITYAGPGTQDPEIPSSTFVFSGVGAGCQRGELGKDLQCVPGGWPSEMTVDVEMGDEQPKVSSLFNWLWKTTWSVLFGR